MVFHLADSSVKPGFPASGCPLRTIYLTPIVELFTKYRMNHKIDSHRIETHHFTRSSSGSAMHVRTLAFLVAGLFAAFLSGCKTPGPGLAKENPEVERRVEALLAQMTLDEKIGQMTQVDMNALKDKSDVQKYAIGSVLSGGGSDPADISAQGWGKAVDEFQSWAGRTRLKIPLIYGIDAVHGHNNVDGAVVFPHNIGLGATRNPALVEKAARVTAREMAATGMRWAFAPCVAVARDPRWGRTYESFGDLPELAEVMGAAAVKGLQGESLAQPDSALACAKHYLGDGGTENGKDQGNMICDEATLRRLHLPGYVAAIKAGAGSVMASYSSWNGLKMHGNRYLLTDVLKGELGFRGLVVSDWAAIDQLPGDYKTAIETSVNAGLDMAMIPAGPGEKNSYRDFIQKLKELVAENRVSTNRINDATRRILRAKFQMGLFDPQQAARPSMAVVGCAEHREVARQCVRESLVLLQNRGNALPLSGKAKRLFVAGKGANDLGMQCGGWTIDWQGKVGDVTKGGTTLLAAMRKAVASGTVVIYAPDGKGAAGADAAVVVIGEMPYAEMKGDTNDLRVSAADLAVLEEVKRTGVPVVTVVLSGRALVLGRVLELSDAVMAAWLPGTEGQGVADVLFGDYSPKGKLPCVWPATMDQVPLRVNAGVEPAPLFPYGFGLVYGGNRQAK